MGRKAGVITINLNAGTSQFVQDLSVAKGGIKDFGAQASGHVKTFEAHTVTSMQASSAAIREAFGGSNVRAVERFIATTLGAGPALQAIFPLVGLAATGALFVEVGEKAYKFFKDIQEAPLKAAGAFRELNAPLAITNDQLRLANDRLDNEIAKLEGRRTNNLKIALDEARLSADQLAESLEKDLKAIGKLLLENEVGFFKSRFGNERTDDIRKRFVTDSGNPGPIPQKVAEITDAGTAAIAAAGTDKDKRDAAQLKLNGDLAKYYASQISELNAELVKAQALQEKFVNPPKKDLDAIAKERAALGPYGGQFSREKLNPTEPGPSDQSTRINDLKGSLRYLNQQQAFIDLKAENEKKTVRKGDLESSRSNEAIDKPYRDRINKLNADIEAAKGKLESIGQSESAQVLAKAFGAATIAIEEVNKAMERTHTQLNEQQKEEIRSREVVLARAQADEQWKTSMEAGTSASQNRIASLQLLTDAIGKGYEATKAANVETKLAQELVAKYNDKGFNLDHGADIIAKRKQIASEFDAENKQRSAAAVDKLGDQIDLERSLAAAQSQGAEATRLVALAYRLREISAHSLNGATDEQIKKEKELFNAQKENLSAANLAALNERIKGAEALAAAQLRGAEAVRLQNLENKYAEMKLHGASSEEIDATRRVDDLDHNQQVTAQALQGVNAYKEQLFVIDQQIDKLGEIIATQGTSIDLTRQLKTLEDERLHVMAQQALSMRGAQDGVRAFFLDMQQQGESTAKIIYDALHSAVDRTSQNLAKALTGQKTAWAAMLKDIGTQLVESTIKQQLQKGIGALGKLIGIDIGGSKPPTGRAGDPLHVVMDGGGLAGLAGAGTSGNGGGLLGGIAGKLGGLFGGAQADGLVYNLAPSLPSFASAFASSVGVPAQAGSAAVHNYSIDARGATDPLIYERIQQAVRAGHDAAVGNAVNATMELNKRTPQ